MLTTRKNFKVFNQEETENSTTFIQKKFKDLEFGCPRRWCHKSSDSDPAFIACKASK